jgi:pyruvate dehydrogenase E1 component alpha subunit
MSHLPIAYPVAVGAAWAYQRAADGRVALAICGDGATSNGRWHEAINTSAIMRLPVVWVVNNNQFAYSTPNEREFAVPTIAERASAYGIPGVRVDGTEVLEVYAATCEAVQRARTGGGPTLIESVSLRWRGHAGHDPAKYVPRELLEHYMLSKDPVKNFEAHLLELGVVDAAAITAMQERVEQAFDAAHAFALASPFPEAGDVSKGVWVEDGYWRAEPGRAGGTEAS